MGAMASQVTSLTVVYSTVYSDADQRKHQSSASLAFVGGIHRSPVNSPHKWPVTRKMFPFDDAIINQLKTDWNGRHFPRTFWNVYFKWIVLYLIKLWMKFVLEGLFLKHIFGLLKLIFPECRIYASVDRVSIGSDNGLSPIRRQPII